MFVHTLGAALQRRYPVLKQGYRLKEILDYGLRMGQLEQRGEYPRASIRVARQAGSPPLPSA